MPRRRDDRGFTFLEVLIVVGLIAAFAAVLGARLGGGFGVAISGGGRVIASELRYASQRALATGRTQRWRVDIDSQAFRLEEQVEEYIAPEDMREALAALLTPPAPLFHFVPVDTGSGNWRWLDDEDVRIEGVRIRGEYFDSGRIPISFGEDGGAENALVYLGDSHENVLAVRVTGFTAEVRTVDGEALAAAEEQFDFADEEFGEALEQDDQNDEDELFEDGDELDEDEETDAFE